MKRLLFALIVLAGSVATAADLAAGWAHSAAIEKGRVWTWGDNAYGQLGQPDTERALQPRLVEGVEDAVAVVAAWHTLAVTADGSVYAWGRNTHGQLGNGRFGFDAKETRPVRVAGVAGVVAIAAGWGHSLALTHDGAVYTWGDRSHGQLGDGVRETGSPVATPHRIADLADIVAIAAGGQHSLALRKDGTVFAWGSNWNGQLGNGKLGKGTAHAEPHAVVGADGKGTLAGVAAIAAGGLHSLAVMRDGRLFAWGYNGSGQIPTGKRGSFWESKGSLNVALPTLVLAGNPGAVHAAAGYESTYALATDGGMLSSGWNLYGELGSGYSGNNRDTLGAVVTGRAVVWQSPPPGVWDASLAYRYTDLSHVDKGVKDWAQSDLFRGTALMVGERSASGTATAFLARNSDNVEVQAALAYPSRAEAGKPLTCLLTRLTFGSGEKDNDFATRVRLRWTNRETGETVDLPLDDTMTAQASTRLLPPLGGVTAIASGMHHALARDAAGTIWAWGHNGFGQLGDGGVADRTVAVRLDPFRMANAARAVVNVRREQAAPTAAEAPAPEEPHLNARAFGAKGDGIALDQAALQTAIDAGSQDGGKLVWLPPGIYLTGTLHLRDGTRLHLSEGATILAVRNRDHYPVSTLIHASGVKDIAVTGSGVIDGQGFFTGARDWRHNVILMENCQNVRVEGISTINAGAWTEHYIRCIGLTIKDVTVRSLLPGRNNDGIDLSGCEQVKIEGCTIISDDDAIVIKSQTVARVNRDIEAIRNVCHTYRGAFKLGTETRGAYANILCSDLTCYGAKALELYSVDGSETENVTVENVRAYDALIALNIRLGARLRPSYWAKGLEPKVGYFRNIRIRDVSVEIGERSWREVLLDHAIPDAEWATGKPEAPYDSCISGLPGHLVENVVIDGFKVRVPGGAATVPDAAAIPENPAVYPHGGNFGTLPAHGLFVRHAKDVTVRNATFETVRPDARPPTASLDAPGFTVE